MNTWRKAAQAIRYRLTLQKLTERILPKLGIQIQCYYWIQEGLNDSKPPGLPPDLDGYTFSAFGPDEIRTFVTLVPWRSEAELLRRLDEGKRCFGLKHHGQIAGIVWCNFVECTYPWHRVPLRENEVYVFDQFTPDAFRGKNVASCLLCQTYHALRGMGRDTFYSVVDRFNSSSIRVRQKVNARFLELSVGINLFGKICRHYVIRKYPA